MGCTLNTTYRNETLTTTVRQNRQKNHRRTLIEIEKVCNFNIITAEELLISKYMKAITDKKLRGKLMKETIGIEKKTIEQTNKTPEKRTRKKQFRKH